MYAVILAGGGGTRLWPLSRPEKPKPFLPLLGDASLLQRTATRLAPVMDPDDVYVVTDRRYVHLVRDQLPATRVIAEPMGRNTAPAIALAVSAIDRPEDEVMAVLPADHWVEHEDRFAEILATAAQLATGALDVEDPLITLGVRPDRPATEYGYLRADLDRAGRIDGVNVQVLHAFEEKPTESRARELLDTPGTAWNAGMFLWRRSAIRAALERYTSLMTLIDPAAGSELALRMAYERMTPASIDRAVMEGAAQDHRVVMAALDVGWSDLGSWTALLASLGAQGVEGRIVQAGERVETTPDDLVVTAGDGTGAVAAEAPDGTMTARESFALLRAGRRHETIVAELLARCAQESRP